MSVWAQGELRYLKATLPLVDQLSSLPSTFSKINYLDPRITAAWCKKHDIPVSKLFSKTLVAKCTSSPQRCRNFSPNFAILTVPWAMEVENDWSF